LKREREKRREKEMKESRRFGCRSGEDEGKRKNGD